jgi:hypothetical protein
MGKKKKKITEEGEDPYYDKTTSDLSEYMMAFKDLHGQDSQPLQEEVDETAVIVSGIGRRHGRYRILDSVIEPTTTLT